MRSMRKSAFFICLSAFCLMFLPANLIAQQITATVSGIVTDPNGAIVPGANVTVTSIDTALSKTTTSDDAGRYTVTFLQPGSYNIIIEKAGFTGTTLSNIKLETAQTASLDVQLQVTGGQVQVDVESDSTPLLQTETSNLETTIEQKLVEDLPSIERNIFSFVNLVPGTIDTNAALGNPNTSIGSSDNRNFFDSNFAVNGGRASSNDVLLDGVTNTIGDFNGVAISPPQDGVREFKVVSGVAPAEYGRTGAGIVTISTKSGTRKFHGALYEYYQDGNLNANGYSRNQRRLPRVNQLSRHQFGGAIGGPVMLPWFGEGTKNALYTVPKTFFFFNYELRREKNPFTRILTVPTAKMRNGDFGELLGGVRGSGLTDADGSQSRFGQLYNPYGALVNGKRQAFANNDLSRLPVCAASGARTTACKDPVALAVLQYLPLPNQTGLINNYIFDDTIDFSRDIISGRIDHTVSERQNFFVRYNFEKRRNAPPNFLNSQATNTSIVNDKFTNATINHVYSIKPNLINNFRYGFTRAAAQQGPYGLGFDPTSLGLPAYLRDNAPVLVFPFFNIGTQTVDQPQLPGEVTTGQTGGTGNKQARDTHNASDSVTWITGRHTFKAGGEYRLYRFYPFQFTNPVGTFNFNRFPTRGPIPSATVTPTEAAGSSLATFLLGIPSVATGNASTQQTVAPLTIYHHYGAAYVQDDWKVFRNLTLNLGLRWDFETGTASSQQLITSFDVNAASPLQDRLNLTNLDPFVANLNPGIKTLKGALSFPDGPNTNTNKDRFAPRIGFAYSYNNKTTIRGGFGMFFLPISLEPGSALGTLVSNGQAQPTNFTTGQVTSSTVFLTNPFPNGLNGIIGSSQGQFTRLGDALDSAINPDRPNAYNMQWNLVLQRELAKNLVLDVAYVGSAGRNLPTRDVNLNQLSPDVLAYARQNFNQPNTCGTAACASVAAFLAFRVANPFAGLNSASTPINTQITDTTIPRAQLLRRFPQYTTVTYGRPLIGYSNYHALQINLQKRFSNGWSALANYSWSKLLDTAGAGSINVDATSTEDVFNYDDEYSYSTLDVPHRFTFSFTYELPFGKGKRFGSNINSISNFFLGGFQISGTGVYQRGAPLTVTAASAFTGSGLTAVGNGQRRPNRVSGIENFNREEFLRRARAGESIINPELFSQPNDFEFGNAARTYNDIRRDNYKNFDLSLIKNIVFKEGRQKVQLRVEALNIFNMVVFGTPGLQTGSNTFGILPTTSQGNRPRIIQLVGRYTF